MRIIPAIDILDGKCVRLTQGDYAQQKIYHDDPLEAARSFESAGLTHLHIVDLDGARQGKVINWHAVEQIVKSTSLRVDFGGGIKTTEEIDRLLALGVRQVNIGSIAVKEPDKLDLWLKSFGAGRIILSADVKNRMIAIHGWQQDSVINIVPFLRDHLQRGVEHVTCTDISTDGMLSGPNLELYKELLLHFPQLHLIASGGVSSIDDIYELRSIGVDGVIVGKAIYEGKISLQELTTI